MHDFYWENPEADMRILLAEDNGCLRKLVVEILEAAGHEVVAAANGAEALRVLIESGAAGFDLLLTDIIMPVMNGFELARQVVARWPGLPILYTSGHAPEALSEDCSIVPAPLLAKPFRMNALLSAVEACVSAASGIAAGRQDTLGRLEGRRPAWGRVSAI
jgi:CheY-like chemotaxis protein